MVLKDWITAVKEADEKLKDNRKCSHKIFHKEAVLHAAKCPALSNHSHVDNSDICASTSGSSDSLHMKHCPKLDPEECNLLMKHNGCFKC